MTAPLPHPAPPFLAVARPRLPSADALLPYLREIDQTRWYSNGGPLLKRFEARLAGHFAHGEPAGSGPEAAVAVVSSATTGLTLALLAALEGRHGVCLMPSWTFAASVSAVIQAGLTPHFLDVAADRWLLDRAAVEEVLSTREVAAILLVVPSGSVADLAPWDALARRHGVALVVDAADGFDTVRPGPVPQIVSLHACKAFGVGEGGLAVATDPALIGRIRRLANFGFDDRHRAVACGLNGKMSEYAAAVGLAALDQWPETRRAWLAAADLYRALLQRHGLSLMFDEGHARSTALVELPAPLSMAVEAAMRERAVEVRRWWGDGCHRHPAFAAFPCGDLRVTAALAARVVGLPFHADLDAAAAERVVALLADTLTGERPTSAR